MVRLRTSSQAKRTTADDGLAGRWDGFKLADAIGPILFGPCAAALFWQSASPTRLAIAGGLQALLAAAFALGLFLGRANESQTQSLHEAWAGAGSLAVGLMPWIISPSADARFGIALILTMAIGFDTMYMSLRNSRWWEYFLTAEVLSFAVWFIVHGEAALAIGAVAFGFHMLDGQRGVRRMFTSLQQARTKSEILASTDALTGLHNRRGLTAHLAEIAERDLNRVVFAVIDIDNFKQINDQFGHTEGDRTIVSIADRIVSHLGPAWFVARAGGDEFMAVTRTGIVQELQRVKDTLSAHTQPVGARAVHLSIGVASGPASGELVKDATAAVHIAKRRGKNQIVNVDNEMRERIRRDRDLSTLVATALENDEIDMWVQPIVDRENDRVFGYECLARWQRPDGTMVGPDSFIPLIAKLGLSHEMGALAMNRAAAFAEALPLGLKVTVNISASHFLSDRFLDLLSSVVKNTGINPGRLIIEITESEHLRNAPQSVAVAREVRRRGFGLAVDDFGSGYSSVERLIALPLSHLKLDRVLVRTCSTPATRHLLAGVAHFAEKAGVTVVAEGIETSEHELELRRLGIHIQQGYFHGHPAPTSTVLGAHGVPANPVTPGNALGSPLQNVIVPTTQTDLVS